MISIYSDQRNNKKCNVIEALDGQLITNKYSQDVDRLVECKMNVS